MHGFFKIFVSTTVLKYFPNRTKHLLSWNNGFFLNKILVVAVSFHILLLILQNSNSKILMMYKKIKGDESRLNEAEKKYIIVQMIKNVKEIMCFFQDFSSSLHCKLNSKLTLLQQHHVTC